MGGGQLAAFFEDVGIDEGAVKEEQLRRFGPAANGLLAVEIVDGTGVNVKGFARGKSGTNVEDELAEAVQILGGRSGDEGGKKEEIGLQERFFLPLVGGNPVDEVGEPGGNGGRSGDALLVAGDVAEFERVGIDHAFKAGQGRGQVVDGIAGVVAVLEGQHLDRQVEPLPENFEVFAGLGFAEGFLVETGKKALVVQFEEGAGLEGEAGLAGELPFLEFQVLHEQPQQL